MQAMNIGTNIYGYKTANIMNTEIVLNRPYVHIFPRLGSCISTTVTSLENLARIRPTGFESKNRIWDLATQISIAS